MALTRKKLAASGVAIMATEAWAYIFDDVLYPLGIVYFGIARGGSIMTASALILNYLLVVFYRQSKSDWYGFEAAHEKDLEALKVQKSSFVNKVLNHRSTAFIFLSIKDPFLGFVYMKGKSSESFRFNTADSGYFILANIIGNAFWILILGFFGAFVGSWLPFVIGFLGLALVFRKHFTSTQATPSTE